MSQFSQIAHIRKPDILTLSQIRDRMDEGNPHVER